MANSYQIPWAFCAATEPTSFSHDRKETGTSQWSTRTAGLREPRNTPTGTAPCLGANGTDHTTMLGTAHTLADGQQGQRSMKQAIIQVLSFRQVSNRDQVAHPAMQTSSWSLYDPPTLSSSVGVDSRLQLLACGLYQQHCPHNCWQGMHRLPKCGSALVTMLLLACLAGPSASGWPANSTPWGWEPSQAPPRTVSFQQYLPSSAWIRGISWIPLCSWAPSMCICCDTCCSSYSVLGQCTCLQVPHI